MSVYIDGLGTVQTNTQVEYTTAAVTGPYTADLTTLQTILNKASPTAADYTKFIQRNCRSKKFSPRMERKTPPF